MDEEYAANVAGVQCPKKQSEVVTPWDSLPSDLLEKIFHKLDYEDLFRCRIVSKSCMDSIESDSFRQSRGDGREGSFTAINYTIKNNTWRWCGYDVKSGSWRSLPTYTSCLPSPYGFTEYSVSCHRSLMCGYVPKQPDTGELVVFNPLTGRKRVLPPLLNPRIPVLVHISVDSGGKSYTVVAAGSSCRSDLHLGKKVEVFCSSTSKWTEEGQVLGRSNALHEYQTGVSINGVLYCIASLRDQRGLDRGVVAFDVKKGTWVESISCPIPFSRHAKILQLVECNGKLHLFLELRVFEIVWNGIRYHDDSVEHCIYVLDSADIATVGTAWQWTNVLRVKKCGVRRSPVYPEYTCVSFGEEKLCVFHTLRRDGVVYDLRDGSEVARLPPPPANQRGRNVFTVNPATFTLQPSFDSDPCLDFLC